MEQNTPLMAKKIWNIMRVAFYMLRKGICKKKILMDLNLVMKRGNKIAGKALQNHMFHHLDNHHNSISKVGLDGQSKPQGEYQFSCSNTPLYRHYFTNNKRSKNQHNKDYSLEDMKNIEAVNNMFDMMLLNSSNEVIVAKSPELGLGFGTNPALRRIRVTDSPFPLRSGENDEKHVDEAADEFIKKFYSQLKQQKYY